MFDKLIVIYLFVFNKICSKRNIKFGFTGLVEKNNEDCLEFHQEFYLYLQLNQSSDIRFYSRMHVF